MWERTNPLQFVIKPLYCPCPLPAEVLCRHENLVREGTAEETITKEAIKSFVSNQPFTP